MCMPVYVQCMCSVCAYISFQSEIYPLFEGGVHVYVYVCICTYGIYVLYVSLYWDFHWDFQVHCDVAVQYMCMYPYVSAKCVHTYMICIRYIPIHTDTYRYCLFKRAVKRQVKCPVKIQARYRKYIQYAQHMHFA